MWKKDDFRLQKRHVVIFVIILLLGLLNLKAQSQVIEWQGTVDSLWTQPGNWSGGVIPAASDDVIIKNNGAAFHPVITATASCRTLKIEKGALLKCSGNSLLYVYGSFNNDGNFSPGTGTVTFSGITSQAIQGEDAVWFFNLTIDNKSPEGISAHRKICIHNQLTFLSGCLTTPDTIVILNDSKDAVAGYSQARYIRGNLKRCIRVKGQDTYFFPVGKQGANQYFPASIDTRFLEGTRFVTVSFQPLERYIQSYLNTHDEEMTYEYLAAEGMWIISPDAEPTSGWFDLRLYTENVAGLNDNMFSIVRRASGAGPDAWTANFGEQSPFGGEGRKVADGFAMKKYCNSFSEYAIGGGGVPIPIELLDFRARLEDGAVYLTWSTATESNNAFFLVEKSSGTDFREVARVEGSGNSTVQRHYSAIDEKPFWGTSYYRLKQIDFSGQYKYSEMVAVKNKSDESMMIFFPNPSEGTFRIRFSSLVPQATIVVFNQQGTVSFSKSFGASAMLELDLRQKLLPGTYYMQISTGSDDWNIQKIVID